jgi:hypothetical protein
MLFSRYFYVRTIEQNVGNSMIQKNIKQSKTKSINHTFHMLLTCFFSKRRFINFPIQKVLSHIPLLYLITILLLLLPAACAGGPDIIANGVTSGLTDWITDLSDSMMSTAVSYQNESAMIDNPITGGIFFVASYTYDPYQNESVRTMIEISALIWFFFMVIYAFAGYILINIKNSCPHGSQAIAYITGINTESGMNQYIQNILLGLGILLFSHAAIYITLLLNTILTKLVMLDILASIAPTPDNIVLYFMMGVSYLLMSFFFWIRFFTINLFAGFALAIGVAYILSNFTRRISVWCMKFFISMVFMQFIIVLVTSWGISCIQGAHDMGFLPLSNQVTAYTALMILLVGIGFVMLIGWAFIKSTTTKAVRLIV